MPHKLDQYLDAATRPKTRSGYASALRHFEVDWGGLLPASAERVARYLADHAEQFAANTLRQRLAALSNWHTAHGFADPTRQPIVKQALRGIRVLHARPERRATPLQLEDLGRIADWLDHASQLAKDRGDHTELLRHRRDRALILLGFWRGFRSDELVSLQVDQLTFEANGLRCFLKRTKTDEGATFTVPALTRWCPVDATRHWIDVASLSGATGALFRKVSASGQLATKPLHPNSIIPLLRRAMVQTGLPAETYTSHSLRRGFANWATRNGWDLKSLMAYVGWRDAQSAMRYIDAAHRFALSGADPAPPQLALAAPDAAPIERVRLELRMTLERARPGVRGLKQAQTAIVQNYLSAYAAQRLDAKGTRYRLEMSADDLEREEEIATLLQCIHRVAMDHECSVEAHVTDKVTGRRWD